MQLICLKCWSLLYRKMEPSQPTQGGPGFQWLPDLASTRMWSLHEGATFVLFTTICPAQHGTHPLVTMEIYYPKATGEGYIRTEEKHLDSTLGRVSHLALPSSIAPPTPITGTLFLLFWRNLTWEGGSGWSWVGLGPEFWTQNISMGGRQAQANDSASSLVENDQYI